MTPNKQVSPVIRISQGERDASARATHLEAATRKFLVTTNERKQMSTKTNFKRIALVAVAALGMGVLSSVPSQAAIVGVPVVTTTNGTATLTNSDSTTGATLSVRFNATGARDSVVITVSLGSQPAASSAATSQNIMHTAIDTATSTGGAPKLAINGLATATAAWRTETQRAAGTSDSATAVTKTTAATGASGAPGGAGIVVAGAAGQTFGKFRYHLDTALARVAGTYTFDYYTTVYSADSAGTVMTEVTTSAAFGQFTIVVSDGSAAAADAVAAAGTSTAVMYGGAAYVNTGTVDSVVSAVNTPKSASGEAIAAIRVTLKTAAGDAARESITVTTNIGNVGNIDGTSLGKTTTLIGNTSGVNDIGVFGDGTSGVATITIKSTSVTFSSKQVTFYSTSVDKYEVTVLGSTIGNSSANALLVKTYDASGNLIVDNTSAYAYSSDLDVINTGATTGTACSYSATSAGQICALTGSANGTADITIRNKSTVALSTKASTAVKLTVNTNVAAKVSIAFDKATYAPGEAAYIRVVAVDAAGTNVGPNSAYTNLLTSAGITSSVAFGNGSETTTASNVNLRYTTASSNGYASNVAIGLYKVYMPASGGTVTITAKGGTALPAAGQVTVTASASVTDSGAAALAAVNALATTVASLRTLITTLTNLVLKIQKKVKA
jgi:hypothetical protein